MSAGLAPGAALSPTAEGLLEGSSAEPFLDREAPRKLETVGPADRLIAASNAHIRFEIPGAETWRLHSAEVDERLRDEIHERVNALADSLRGD